VSRWTPCRRSDFIRKLRRLGFDGPFTGTRHQFMVLSQKRSPVRPFHAPCNAGLPRRYLELPSAPAGLQSSSLRTDQLLQFPRPIIDP
jgi:hypothetical protein